MKNVKYCSLETVQAVAQNINKTIAYVDAKNAKKLIDDSKNWYGNAKKLCKDICRELHIDCSIVAGVIAVLSPNQNWDIQQKFTKGFIQDILNGTPYKNTGYGYYTNREKAANMILNNRVYPYLSGQKVTAFYNNIMGDYSTVTLDLWAIRIALGNLDMPKKDTGKYMRDFYLRDEIVRGYEVAAKQNKLPVAVLQSLSWVIARNHISKNKV